MNAAPASAFLSAYSRGQAKRMTAICERCHQPMRASNRVPLCRECGMLYRNHVLRHGRISVDAWLLHRQLCGMDAGTEHAAAKCRGGCARPPGEDGYCFQCRARAIEKLSLELAGIFP